MDIKSAMFDDVRVSRTTYLVTGIVLSIGLFLAMMLCTVLIGHGEHFFPSKAIGWIGMLTSFIFTLYCSIKLAINRLHDIGISGWWVLLNFIPYIDIGLLLFLLFMPPKDLVNEYGTVRA